MPSEKCASAYAVKSLFSKVIISHFKWKHSENDKLAKHSKPMRLFRFSKRQERLVKFPII